MGKIVELQKESEVLDKAEVIIVGGGPAGIGASLAAARNGAKTILLERFGSLGGMQTKCFSPMFTFVDTELHGGIMMEIINRLDKEGAVKKPEDMPEGEKDRLKIKKQLIAALGEKNLPERILRTEEGYWGNWRIAFDGEYYKYLLDIMMEESGVKLYYHAFAVGVLREGNSLKGIIIESKEGRQAILGKVFIDCTGDGDIVWKSGAQHIGEEGFPAGPNKGRYVAYGYAFFIGGVDLAKFNKFKKENPEEWGQVSGGKRLIKQAKREGKLYFDGGSAILSEVQDVYKGGRIWVMAPSYRIPKGHSPWMVEEMTKAEIEMRKQSRSLHNLFKEKLPGFENSYLEKTPVAPIKGSQHRLHGEYILNVEDMREGRIFEDSIGVSNMPPDVFGPEGEYRFAYEILPHDIPYRCLISKDTDNLMAAGTIISAELVPIAGLKYCAPCMTTGQAAGTAAALAVKNNVTPKNLDIKLLQKTLSEQGGPVTVKGLSEYILAPYKLIKKLNIEIKTRNYPEELI